MSIMEKCMAYAEAHSGVLPSFEKMDELVSEQLGEYLKELSDAVIPEYHDIPPHHSGVPAALRSTVQYA